MKRLPQRISLVSQTADILREQIGAGGWKDSLPGERELAQRLRVSRPTLRIALDLLRREGLIQVTQGRRREIRPNKKKSRTLETTKRVGLVTPIPVHRMPPFVMFWVDELRERLADDGFDLEVQVSAASGSAKPAAALDRLVKETPAAAWVLFLSTEPMQRWFAERDLPCVLSGSSFAGLSLPSIDVDSHAACQHAVGLFASKGHHRVALLLPDGGAAGDRASEAGFLEGAAKSKNISAVITRHDGTVEGICKKLDGLLGGSNPVTGVLVARSVHALTAMTHLQRRGLKLPRDIALISRDNDPFLDSVVPRVTRYACNPATFARRLSRIVLQLSREGSAPARHILLTPELIKGETLV